MVYPAVGTGKFGLPNKAAFNTSYTANVMKKLILGILLGAGSLTVHADGYNYYHGHHGHSGPTFSFSFGAYPYYSSYPYYSYPAYSYPVYSSPVYSAPYSSGYGYGGYTRPNYAVGGTLLGALAGGIIGNSVHHQGWEGAGIGAAAGLFLGSLAESNARAREQSAYAAPQLSYSQANYIPDAPVVNNAPTVNNAPSVPDAPRVPSSSYTPASSMSGANSLFGR